MKAGSRANVASSFTVVKGAMIDETYAVFAAWDFERSKRENLDRLREENFIGASSATWLRDVAKVLNRRFDPAGRDRPLVVLAKHGLPVEEWKPLLLWHMTRDEFLVRDFLETWLFAAYDAGAFRVHTKDVEKYLSDIGKRGGTTELAWSEQTTKRVAAGLLKIAVDFGLLRGSIAKEFVSFHLPERSFLYLLHAMRDEKLRVLGRGHGPQVDRSQGADAQRRRARARANLARREIRAQEPARSACGRRCSQEVEERQSQCLSPST